ncbi:ABC transporter permease [Veillonella sp. YH-vei2232]|jgi:oligopeptide transport system permease protein|uniref:ABC transporter permease n=1 Tax=Veillonella absiana TaxID=3079305 RepID=A0ABU3Z9P7_9FIRM|nr:MULTISPECIES: ABC transporter permease [unclassified Veillonella]NCB95111.1 ABC transporter permease [Negativicutes bacterium]MBK7920873.1 ABC transporter permease [Veillonella sp.]MBP6923496.1 ABC transporter permease [Veillonella sp.]MBP8615944.1 ABC transporter permease [Veillonella sp.]MBP9516462.1 ABC transporter permease [Veillonella sp.]
MENTDFLPLQRTDASAESVYVARPSAWYRLQQNKLALVGLGIIVVMIILAIVGPMFSSYTYAEQDLMAANQGPSSAHWFGTDTLGRDLYTRVMYGARISLTIGFVAALINLVIGVIYGGVSGFFGGKVDRVMMGIVDILYGIPLLLYVILLMVVLEPGLTSIFIALGIAYWLTMARIVRSQIIKIKKEEYVIAAQSMGIPSWRILWRHILPNCAGPIIITMTLAIPEAIFTEAFLSFIGLGVSAPMASWGVLAAEGINSMRSYPFQLIFPALAISITMLGFAFFGDGLRNALDPKGGDKS